MANITVTTAAKQIEEVWTPELNRAVEFNLVVASLLDDKTAWLKEGFKVHLPSRGHIAVTAKAAGTSLTPSALTEIEQTFTMTPGGVAASVGAAAGNHYAAAFELEDPAAIQSRYDIRAEYTQSIAYGLARQIDADACTIFKNTPAAQIGSAGVELADDDLIKARNALSLNSAPQPWNMVVSPGAYGGLLKTDKFVNSLYTDDSPSAVQKAKIGQLYGATVYESSVVTTTAAGAVGTTAYCAIWSKPHIFKIIQRQPTTHMLYQPNDLAWQVSMDMLYGVFERLEINEATGNSTTAALWIAPLTTTT